MCVLTIYFIHSQGQCSSLPQTQPQNAMPQGQVERDLTRDLNMYISHLITAGCSEVSFYQLIIIILSYIQSRVGISLVKATQANLISTESELYKFCYDEGFFFWTINFQYSNKQLLSQHTIWSDYFVEEKKNTDLH